MKKFPYKLFFFVSLTPYVIILLRSFYLAIYGTQFFFNRIDGFEAFLFGIIFTPLGLLSGAWSVITIPILPMCLTYQIVYIGSRKKENKRFVWISTLLVAGFIIFLLAVREVNRLERSRIEVIEQKCLNCFIQNADEIMHYNLNHFYGEIGGTNFYT